MQNQKILLILGCILLLVAVLVYIYFFSAESQSSQVQRVDPEKAKIIQKLRDNPEYGTPNTLRHPNLE